MSTLKSQGKTYQNTFVFTENGTTYLRSYGTIVASVDSNNTPTINGWYSATTMRQVNVFLFNHNLPPAKKKDLEVKEY